MRTVDNVYYEFQAAGEFTLLRSPDSSLEIQARQEPYQDSDHVSINTAVVARDNGHKVGIYFDGDALAARVDGAVVDATVPIDLGNGAQISQHERGFEIDFPDGTQLWALSHESYGIIVQLRPSAGLRRDGAGLLGPVVPGGLPVPKLPDGSHLPRATDASQQHQLVYENFANAWRVTAGSSLFDYDAGKSTASYTVANFPSAQTATTPADLTDEQRAQAADACSDTTDLGLLEQCLFDVSITGDDGFATVYAAIGELISQGPGTLDLPIDGGPLPSPEPTPGPPGSAEPIGTPIATPANAVLTGLDGVKGSAVGPDGTLYLSILISYHDDTYKLVAVDPTTGSVVNEVDALGGGQVAVAAGSVWVGEFTGRDACSITRLDAATLAVQTTIPTPCDFIGTAFASTGDAVWYLDRNLEEFTKEGVKRIDPATNTRCRPGHPALLQRLPVWDACRPDIRRRAAGWVVPAAGGPDRAAAAWAAPNAGLPVGCRNLEPERARSPSSSIRTGPLLNQSRSTARSSVPMTRRSTWTKVRRRISPRSSGDTRLTAATRPASPGCPNPTVT